MTIILSLVLYKNLLVFGKTNFTSDVSFKTKIALNLNNCMDGP